MKLSSSAFKFHLTKTTILPRISDPPASARPPSPQAANGTHDINTPTPLSHSLYASRGARTYGSSPKAGTPPQQPVAAFAPPVGSSPVVREQPKLSVPFTSLGPRKPHHDSSNASPQTPSPDKKRSRDIPSTASTLFQASPAHATSPAFIHTSSLPDSSRPVPLGDASGHSHMTSPARHSKPVVSDLLDVVSAVPAPMQASTDTHTYRAPTPPPPVRLFYRDATATAASCTKTAFGEAGALEDGRHTPVAPPSPDGSVSIYQDPHSYEHYVTASPPAPCPYYIYAFNDEQPSMEEVTAGRRLKVPRRSGDSAV